MRHSFGLISVLVLVLSVYLVHAAGKRGFQQPECKKLMIRKEWRTLTHPEKSQWIKAVKCLADVKHERLSLTKDQKVLQGKRSLYDDFSYSHALMEHSAHGNAYFLPWHRWYLYLFDASLRQTCAYSGPTPYWDWSVDHADLFRSPVFESSAEHGLGGTGDCDPLTKADCVVTTGGFATDFELAWPVSHPLRRNFTLLTGWFAHEKLQNLTLGPESVQNATEQTTGDFYKFQYFMTQMHNHLHNLIGGDLSGTCPKSVPLEDCEGMWASFTPNDPLFWLHHAQLDRLWNKWQRRDPLNFAAFSGMPVNPQNMSDPRYDLNAHADHRMNFDTHGVPMAPREVFDVEAWPLCYRYLDL